MSKRTERENPADRLELDCWARFLLYFCDVSEYLSLILTRKGLYRNILFNVPGLCQNIEFTMFEIPKRKGLVHVKKLNFVERENAVQKSFNFNEYFPRVSDIYYVASSSVDLFNLSPRQDLVNLVELTAEINSNVLFVQNFKKLKSATICSKSRLAITLTNIIRFMLDPVSKIELENLPELQCLQVVGFKLSKPNGLDKVTDLTLESSFCIEENFFGKAGEPTFPKLKKLRFRQENNIRKLKSENFPKLEFLEFSTRSWHSDSDMNRYVDVLCPAISGFPSLSSLVVEGFHFSRNQDDGYHHRLTVLENLPELKNLSLSKCKITRICECPKLENVLLDNSSNFHSLGEYALLSLRRVVLLKESYIEYDLNKCIQMESFTKRDVIEFLSSIWLCLSKLPDLKQIRTCASSWVNVVWEKQLHNITFKSIISNQNIDRTNLKNQSLEELLPPKTIPTAHNKLEEFDMEVKVHCYGSPRLILHTIPYFPTTMKELKTVNMKYKIFMFCKNKKINKHGPWMNHNYSNSQLGLPIKLSKT